MNTLRRTITLIIAAAVAAVAATLLLVSAAPAAATSAPELTGTTLTVNHATIYPHVDGYRDTLAITLAKHVTGASGTIPLTGQLTIGRGSTTVAAYPITTSATETYSWNGRVKGGIVSGTYTVIAKVTGPSGTITKRQSVAVSHQKLQTRTKTVTISAQEFFQHSYTATAGTSGCSDAPAGKIACTSAAGEPATGSNFVPVPDKVLQFAGYQPYTAQTSVKLSGVTVVAGTNTYWSWNGAHPYAFTARGTHTTATASFGSDTGKQELEFRIGGGSVAKFDTVSIRYVYSILG